MSGDDALTRLQRWYEAQCDDEWEHRYGVEIGTLDNPGWRVRVDLRDTALEGRDYPRSETHRTDDDWVVTWAEADLWEAACGPLNLTEALERFLTWAAAEPGP